MKLITSMMCSGEKTEQTEESNRDEEVHVRAQEGFSHASPTN